jgi:uncharacterized protein YacL
MSGSPGARAADGQVLDTSLIIDGHRERVRSGFLEGLSSFRFVLRTAISRLSGALRRNRAKRGFDVCGGCGERQGRGARQAAVGCAGWLNLSGWRGRRAASS